MHRYQQYTDEALFALLKESSEPAFHVLFKRYWERLLEQAFYKLQSQQEAEDVVQQVFLEIWKNRTKTTIRFTFNTYVSAVLKYTIFTRLANIKKQHIVGIDGFPSEILPDEGTLHYLSMNELRSNLEKLVNQLPEKCQMDFV